MAVTPHDVSILLAAGAAGARVDSSICVPRHKSRRTLHAMCKDKTACNAQRQLAPHGFSRLLGRLGQSFSNCPGPVVNSLPAVHAQIRRICPCPAGSVPPPETWATQHREPEQWMENLSTPSPAPESSIGDFLQAYYTMAGQAQLALCRWWIVYQRFMSRFRESGHGPLRIPFPSPKSAGNLFANPAVKIIGTPNRGRQRERVPRAELLVERRRRVLAWVNQVMERSSPLLGPLASGEPFISGPYPDSLNLFMARW
ncbi:hypothetical protein BT96DRAFT_950766 [Gymnopus androsaceus JB14]|uniref:Uncharacterized protein n=1 Tax=Gymnopus androsaceus JB14 TaxID=1447944 RepID=A0A6A4GFC8_9AGAR|nr:hypothetical protein BT96DRAFT_950766 [Gymnopus androsaceus JB14]